MKVLVAICMKEHRLSFPKIGRDLRIDLRELRYGAAKLSIFVILKRNQEIALRTNHAIWLFTRLLMCLSGLELCLRVGKKFS